jgi:hypothetical protein
MNTALIDNCLSVVLQKLAADSLQIEIQSFLCDYELSHTHNITPYNPWPGDGAVCVFLCKLVKVSQNIEELNSGQLWLEILFELARTSVHVCLLLILTKFQATLTNLLCMSRVGMVTSETRRVVCNLMTLLLSTKLPSKSKLPMGEGYLEVIIHSLQQSIRSPSPDLAFILSTCQVLLSVITAATTWWLDVSAAVGPTVLSYLKRVALPVLEMAGEQLKEDLQIVACVDAAIAKLKAEVPGRYAGYLSHLCRHSLVFETIN